MIEIKYLSADGMFVADKDIPKLQLKIFETYRVIHDEYGEIGKAKIVKVSVKSRNHEVFDADMETGSLYQNNRCLTGPLELVK